MPEPMPISPAPMAIDNGGSDSDVEKRRSIRRKAADGAAIDAARLCFQFADKFHRADFGRARHGARRKDRLQDIDDAKAVL